MVKPWAQPHSMARQCSRSFGRSRSALCSELLAAYSITPPGKNRITMPAMICPSCRARNSRRFLVNAKVSRNRLSSIIGTAFRRDQSAQIAKYAEMSSSVSAISTETSNLTAFFMLVRLFSENLRNSRSGPSDRSKNHDTLIRSLMEPRVDPSRHIRPNKEIDQLGGFSLLEKAAKQNSSLPALGPRFEKKRFADGPTTLIGCDRAR